MWWIIAVSLVFFGVSVLAWNLAERPPYTFMEGARRWAVETDTSAPQTGVYAEIYVLNAHPKKVARDAVSELGQPWFDWGEGEVEFLLREPEPDVLVTPVDAAYSGPNPPDRPFPASTRTVITICYPAHTPISRIRAWLSDLGL